MKYIRPAWRGSRLPKILRRLSSVVRRPSARRPLLFGIPILVSALALIGAAAYNQASEPDTDSDRMFDVYELFFGLNPTNPADADQDYDGDHLSNLQESAQLTDPFVPDTDRDGFNDNEDANPISRAYIGWGDQQFTTGDQYDYAHPDWFLGAYKLGGEWAVDAATTQSAWHVASTEPPDVGSLSIDLDRTILTNNLVYAIHYSGGRATASGRAVMNSSLYVDLLDTNGAVVVENLYGNLMTVSNATGHVVIPAEAGIQFADAVLLLEIPTAIFINAAVIHLRRGGSVVPALSKVEVSTVEPGEVVVYEGLVYIDEDGDGLDTDQERQIGTSDYCVDSNGNGTNDYDECFHCQGGSSTNNPPSPEPPSPPEPNPPSPAEPGIIYVDQAIGNDSFTGRAPAISVANKGPKKTIHKGMAAVDEDGAHTLIIKSGDYHENLNISGKDVKVFIEGNVRL